MASIRVTIRTPRETVFQGDVLSVRLPTESGQVGLRGGAEPTVLAFEPGLIVLRGAEETQLVGTAGGLLHGGRDALELLTPLAVMGRDRRQVTDALEEALAEPRAEWEARTRLGRLEDRLLRQFGAGRAQREATRGWR